MTEILVEISDVSKQFGKGPPALSQISASIAKGEMVGLAGPDGAGKTTLLRLIAGLLLPTTGTIRIGPYDTIKDASQIRHLIGYMPQKFGLYEDLTVQQNLNLYADLRGVPQSEMQALFEKLLQFTGLSPFTGRLAGALSGGMKQKLGLACALMKKPTLLLLDEPSVGVDPLSRRELWKMVHELLQGGISVIWSTAYLDEAERCGSVIVLDQGKLLFKGRPQDVTEKVKGRVFSIGPVVGNLRTVLTKTLCEPGVSDAVIQGDGIRVVTKSTQPQFSLADVSAGTTARLTPIAPRFEDAYIDILGGDPGGHSELAEMTPQVVAKHKIMIEADGLTKRFGSFTAASDINLHVSPGEIFGLLGPNGAGKTTTFKMMCGLLKPTSGRSFVNGIDLQVAPGEARSHIGYMAQKFSLYGTLSVLANLEFFSGVYGLEGSARREAIGEMVEVFGFSSHLNEVTELLPLGFKQRLSLACALMHHPAILFLDEPTSGVDPITRREFWKHINGLVHKGVTVIVTTHFMDEAEYCDRIGLVYRSKMIQVGSPQELKRSAIGPQMPNPTLEDAFIHAIETYDKESGGARRS